MNEKTERLENIIREMGSVVIAFSSGVDSTFLLKVAHDAIGDKCIAVTAKSEFFPARESEEAELFCRQEGIRQIFFDSDQLESESFASNPADRCYHCKLDLFRHMKRIASDNGIKYVADGSNVDDEGDYRPGLKALQELGIRSPLKEAGFTKPEIRMESERLGLASYNKQPFACLASRFPYGEMITAEKLKKVEAAEETLRQLGLGQYRVRIHQDTLARIEVAKEGIQTVVDNRDMINARLSDIGFKYICVDLKGYRSGSMNEVLEKK